MLLKAGAHPWSLAFRLVAVENPDRFRKAVWARFQKNACNERKCR